MVEREPQQEAIPPQLEGAFRVAVLQRIAERGARTLQELERDPPWVLGLPLERIELEAALDLSRRHREIEPLSEDASEISTAEWGLTEFGRARAERLTARALSWIATSALTVLGGVVALVAGVGFDISLDDLDADAWFAVGTVLVFLIEFVLLVLLDYRYGVPRKEIADEWKRYRTKRPRGHGFYSRRPLMLRISLGVIVVFAVLIFVPRPTPVLVFAILVVIALIGLHAVLARSYLRARSEWRSAKGRGAPGEPPP